MGRKRTDPIESFWGAVDKNCPNGCWEFTGAKTNGYGILFRAGRNVTAHRYAWVIARGEIPPGMNVLHSCDNRACCNPEHLRLGTDQENADDRRRRGRSFVRPLALPGWVPFWSTNLPGSYEELVAVVGVVAAPMVASLAGAYAYGRAPLTREQAAKEFAVTPTDLRRLVTASLTALDIQRRRNGTGLAKPKNLVKG